ncbi:MAG TPA: D-2-hydroxyacid dehydrogenase family protein [Thermoanaerobaculia bacterium]|nr:D-2-hydroxyacid dehydrogenase family protein [Thermoanaerobaculia bacterium]
MKIVIPDDYRDVVRQLDAFAKLRNHDVTIYNDSVHDLETLAERFKEAEALVLIRERTQISDALLERLPKLKVIAQTGRGTTHIDADACARRGIRVTTGSGSPIAPAELTWALIMSAMRHIPAEVAGLREGRWQTTALGRVLRGRTLAIYGYGKIGALVAGYGRAFQMRVVIWGREGSATRATQDGFEVAPSREAFFENADVLSLHLKLSKETQGIVTAGDLARMKPDALLVNTARAELIEPGALLAALRNGRPGFAALDVFESEPAIDDPLVQLPNVTATPHLGYVEKDSYELYFGEAFDSLG